ncbi:putative YigZ family protein [Prevotella amnii CRIS 21A-A]|uniref:Putative YigZ family protein n=1 Tax=Prevotella amnii CRIS 21A-A TaxID=679191 RepID=E1GVS0_9BACT|nr:YigZ family protein [Prevotella amnii]EFN91250.1 putative YigZ family protein [Prevotella amnii CRIS 21A-A]
MCNDKYKTILETRVGEGFYSEKRSKFFAFAHHVCSSMESLDIVKAYRKRFYDARHCCYAYVIGADRSEFRAVDDGEPSSTAGKPILGQINSNSLTNILVVVVRYYGGINLGTSGLIEAYRTAAAAAISNCIIEERFIEEHIKFVFSYLKMNVVMRIIKDMKPRIIDQSFDNMCEMVVSIRQSKVQEFRERLDKVLFD